MPFTEGRFSYIKAHFDGLKARRIVPNRSRT
jgi:hypothetical protein